MQGNAVMARGASYFDVPMLSHVIDNLYQGCSPSEFPEGSEIVYEENFTHILDLYPWGAYAVGSGVTKLSVEMYDGADAPDLDSLDSLAHMVSDWMDHHGAKVLVHCQAGLNRSSLVVARVLMHRYNMKAYEAMLYIRKSRSEMCLCNPDFQKFLLQL